MQEMHADRLAIWSGPVSSLLRQGCLCLVASAFLKQPPVIAPACVEHGAGVVEAQRMLASLLLRRLHTIMDKQAYSGYNIRGTIACSLLISISMRRDTVITSIS